jgi:pathogenesis-related protein 1
MRSTLNSLFLSCLVALAACSSDGVDGKPDDGSDDGVDEDHAMAVDAGRRDAGHGSSGGDASTRADASSATHDASAQATHDSGSGGASNTHDAGSGGTGGDAGSSSSGTAGVGETGRLVGMTAAHNAVREKVMTSPMIPDMVWSAELAKYAQEWTDTLAGSQATCDQPMHRSGSDLQKKGYGENLAFFSGVPSANSTAAQATNAWAAEVACWTYGTLSGLGVTGTEKCDTKCYTDMHSDGCGHYTQVVWRKSTQVGCGVSTCKTSRGLQADIWICNYNPAGNFVGMAPY